MLFLCVVGLITVIVCDLVAPFVIRQLLNQLSAKGLTTADLPRLHHTVIYSAVVIGLSWFGWRAVNYANVKYQVVVMKDLTDDSFEYLHRHSTRFFSNGFVGAFVKRVGRFATSFETIADQCTLELGQTIIRMCFIFGILYWMNHAIGRIFLGWGAFFLVVNFFFVKWKLKFDFARAKLDTKVTAQLADTISNNANIKTFSSLDREVSEFKSLTLEHLQARLKSWNLGFYADSTQGLAGRIMQIMMLWVAVGYVVRGELTTGDVFVFYTYLQALNEGIRQIGKSVQKIYESMADANEMTEIHMMPHEIVDAPDAATLMASKGSVEFRNVQFSYVHGGRLVLRDFNLKVRGGERVGIVGPSGGGKSTVLKLLERFHDLTSGEILLDYQNIAKVVQSSLRGAIAYVPQEPSLFHRTLMENIRYSRPDATDEDVIRAAKAAHCHEFISGFPQGYETLVGERGVKLSGGERQRVAIARAFLMNAPILLLDEATSSLDSGSERYIQDALSKLFVGRTVIAVAHRLSTVQKMDRIVVVDQGHVAEDGVHDELIKQGGIYCALYNLQKDPEDVHESKYLQ